MSCSNDSLKKQLGVDMNWASVYLNSFFLFPRVLTWSFLFKVSSAALCPFMFLGIPRPTSLAFVTTMDASPTAPVAILRRARSSSEKRVPLLEVWNGCCWIFAVFRPSGRPHLQVLVSCVLPVASYRSCNALFICAHVGLASTHFARWASVIPRPLVNPPDVFAALMSVCSIVRSDESPPQYLPLLLTMWFPSKKLL